MYIIQFEGDQGAVGYLEKTHKMCFVSDYFLTYCINNNNNKRNEQIKEKKGNI